MINKILRENCNHCLKNVYIGQPMFECSRCNCIAHSKCFSQSKAQIINDNFYCFSCKDKIVHKYNPFKHFVDDTTSPDAHDETYKISSILDKCQAYSANEINSSHGENLKKFSSSYFLNIDGNKSNFDSLLTELHRINQNFTVIGLSETNIGPDEGTVYSIPNYNSFYQNTVGNKSKGTGVALYVQDRLSSIVNELASDVTENLESLFVTSRKNSEEVTFGVIYRPPSGNFASFLTELSRILQILPKKSAYIMGDFNVNLHVNSKEVNNLEEIMFSAGFSPLISTHTHEKPGCNQTCIDNIYTNDINKVVASGTLSDRISHHLPVFNIFEDLAVTNSEPQVKHTQYYDYSESNVRLLVSSLNQHFSEHPPNNFIEFHDTFKTNLDKSCKLSKPKVSKRTPLTNPWITGGLIASINKKHELHDHWHRAKREKCLHNPGKLCHEIKEACHCHPCNDAREKHANFTDKRRRVKHVIRLAQRHYTCNKIEDCQGDSKKTWQLINQVRGKQNKQIKPSFMINNERVICRRVIAHEFNKYFVSIASNLNEVYERRIDEDPIIVKSFTDYLPQSCPSSIYLAECTSSEIINIISEFKNGKASDIPTHVMKQCSQTISEHLARIYNNCMNEGVFPSQLKTGKITPIYKKEDEELLENYRPVSTLPVFGKIFEKIIYSRLYNFFLSRGIIFENQFGFRKNHSTSHALNFSVNHVEEKRNNKNHVLGIFIDLSKAFDTLPFDMLLKKLSNYGVRGNALKLLSSYLNNRSQYVSVLGEESEPLPVNLGVPQGSVLGPLLFLIYINDIYRCSTLGKFVLFADDTNIFVSAETKEQAYKIANEILDSVCQYMRHNLLHINVKKSCYMYFSPTKRNTVDNTENDLNLEIDGIPIKQVTETKFLGVIIDDKLSWTPHIEKLTKKLNSICGRIYRIKNSLPSQLYKQIYHTLFESHLGYGISVWGGVSINKLSPLFLAQKKCVRILFGDSEAFSEKFKTCSRSRPIQCSINKKGQISNESTIPHIKPCSICISLRKTGDRQVRPHRCQILGAEFHSRESTKPIFQSKELMTVHNIYRYRCITETMKIVKSHQPISMYSLFKKSELRDDRFVTPHSSHNFAYKGANLWNTFLEQSNARGKIGSLGSIKSRLKSSIMTAQHQSDNASWQDLNFNTFL